MGYLVAVADGNFTSSSSWAACSAAAQNDSEASFTTLTTGNTDSSTFVLEAVTVDGVLIKLAARASGSPSNTITVHLRNSTTSTNVLSLTVNVSDLAASDTTERQGGWYLFKFSSTHTPNGTDSYLIRVTLSSTSTSCSLWVNTGTNLTRMVRTTTTQAPAAADRMIVVKEMTAAATSTTRTITMDNTASTVFGTTTGLSTSNYSNAAIAVGNGGTFTWGTSAATAYLLNLVGSIVVHNGGVYRCGNSGSEIPRDSTAIVEFQPATSGDSRFGCLGGSTVTIYGLSRTSGKNVVWCLLNTDEAAAQTVLGVDTDTGWKSGDDIGIASTSRTATEGEIRTLSGDAGASSITVSSGLTNAHKGSAADGIQGEVILLTRNVVIRTNNSARFTCVEAKSASTVTLSWVHMKYHGFASNNIATTSSGSFTAEYCSGESQTSSGGLFSCNNSGADNISITHCVSHSASGDLIGAFAGASNSNWTITNCVSTRASSSGFSISSVLGTFHTNRAAGSGSVGFNLSGSNQYFGTNFGDNLVSHSNAGAGISSSSITWRNRAVTGWVLWRNTGSGMSISPSAALFWHNARLDDLISFGNSTTNITITSHTGELTLRNPTIAGDTGFATGTGLDLTTSTGQFGFLRIEGGVFGGGGGTKTTHTTRDILFGGSAVAHALRLQVIETELLSSTEIAVGSTLSQGSWYSYQHTDGAFTNTKTVYVGRGTVAYETSVVHSPYTVSEKLTPSVAANATLLSSPTRLKVDNGGSYTVSVYVRKDSSYNGSITPRMILKANPAVGVDTEVTLDTMSVGADTWEQLSAALPAIATKGKVELAVEVNGTAGNVYVSEWAVA